MILKQLADVTLADIEALVTSSVPEGRTLEYKAQFPGARDRDKQEFLHDVIAFANSDGGDLIFGVEARAGVATAVPGALLTDPDAAILQLEGMLSSSVEPRIAGLRTHPIEVTPGAHVIVMRVPPSFAAPHAARNGTTRRFYSRDSRGKREMDVHELRVAFGASEGLVPRLVALHEDAVRAVIDGELPFQLEGGPRAILSIMPMSALREPRELELDHATAVHPVLDQGTDWSHSLEGFYIFGVARSSPTRAFALTRRTGQVDFSWLAGREVDGRPLIWSPAFEETLVKSAVGTATKLGAFGIEGPFAIALTLIRAKGFRLQHDFYSGVQGPAMWRDRVTLPIVTVDTLDREALLPLARSFWYAMGETRPDRLPFGKDG